MPRRTVPVKVYEKTSIRSYIQWEIFLNIIHLFFSTWIILEFFNYELTGIVLFMPEVVFLFLVNNKVARFNTLLESGPSGKIEGKHKHYMTILLFSNLCRSYWMFRAITSLNLTQQAIGGALAFESYILVTNVVNAYFIYKAPTYN